MTNKQQHPSKDDFNEWSKIIPFINFPPEWQIQVLPQGRRQIARFRVTKHDFEGYISIIFEEYCDQLQWEVAQVFEGDVETNPPRLAPEETKELIECIAKKLITPPGEGDG